MNFTAKEYLKLLQWPMIVLLTHIIAGYLFGLYFLFTWFDNPMHFAGGMSIAASSYALFEILNEKQHLTAKPWVYALLAIALTGLTAIGWEIMEYSGDILLGTLMQPSLTDTMKDLCLGILGAITISILKITFITKK